MKIATDHGFPKGTMPTDDTFDLFKNERDYLAQIGKNKTSVAAMDWAAAEIVRLRLIEDAAKRFIKEADTNPRYVSVKTWATPARDPYLNLRTILVDG